MYPIKVLGTTSQSTNATCSGALCPDGVTMRYDIAWEQDVSSTKSLIT